MNNLVPTWIQFDKKKLRQLKKAYDQAVENKQESYMFEENEYLTIYAKYLIEYLEERLK